MSDTILAPLTPFDQSWLERHGLTKGYIVKNVDIQALKAAAIRVVDKWRLLAGHLQWSNKLSSWCIQVPLQGDISHRVKFTTKKLATHLGPPFMIGSSSTILTRPPLKYFRDSSVPHDLRSFASSKAPFISIHVTEFLNCACVGISFTHGILDGFAFGMFMDGLTRELKGIPWEAPAISEINPLREVLKDLETTPPMYDPNDSTMIGGLRRTFVPYTTRNNMVFEGSIAYQEIFDHLENKMLYIRGKGLETLFREVKDEIKKSGCDEPVSVADILAMWILKAGVGVLAYTGNILNTEVVYAKERLDTNSVCVQLNVSFRGTMAKQHPEMRNYYHNGVVICPLPPFSKEEIAKKTLGELAVLHRQGLAPARSLGWIQAYHDFVRKEMKGKMVFSRKRGEEVWLFTNLIIANLTDIDLGGEIYATWGWFTPGEADHIVGITSFKDGYIIEAKLPRARWSALAEAAQSLEPAKALL